MARRPRVVIPGLVHHVTQHGNNRQPIFFCADDRLLYLDLLRRNATRNRVRFVAYCLMPNHVHLLVIPETAMGLGKMMQTAHADYALAWNQAEARSGHFWQGRFASCPLEASEVVAAARYIELNPVRARLAATAWDYPWSSARARTDAMEDQLLPEPWNALPGWDAVRWKESLLSMQEDSRWDALRRATRTGVPVGPPAFVEDLERRVGRRLTLGRPGRPRKSAAAP